MTVEEFIADLTCPENLLEIILLCGIVFGFIVHAIYECLISLLEYFLKNGK